MTTVKNYVNYLWKFVSNIDNIEELKQKLEIDKFIEGAIDFNEFNSVVAKHTENLRFDNTRAKFLNFYAAILIKNEIKLKNESVDKVKKLLKDLIAPLKFEKLEGNSVIEATATNIMLNNVIDHVEKDDDFIKGVVKEVRVIASAILHINCDLKKEKWHGKNFVVITDMLNVVKKPTVWNFSGQNQLKQFDKAADQDENGDGMDGKDGDPGKSGGNVYICAKEAKDSENLTIITNGGTGGTGQSGGNGKDGLMGSNATIYDVKSFPNCANLKYSKGKENYKEAKEEIERLSSSKLIEEDIDEDDGRFGNSYMRATLHNGKEVVYICYQLIKCLVLVKGTHGTRGGKGGRRGLGGEGGYAGTIDFEIEKNSRIQVRKI